MAAHGENEKSFVTLDELMFIDTSTDECKFNPPEAAPPEPTTTPEPTEPPDGKPHKKIKFHQKFLKIFHSRSDFVQFSRKYM